MSVVSPPMPERAAIVRRRTHWLLLAAWGVLMALAYPRVNLWPLAHLALVPLTLLAVRAGRGRGRAMALDCWLAGTIWWLVMAWWVSLTTWPGYVVLSGYMALYVMLYAVLMRAIDRALALPLVVTAPVLWVAMEYVRGTWVLTGFPWFLLGQSQPTVLIQIADVVGAYGVSFVVAMTGGMICDVLLKPLIRVHHTGWRRWGVPITVSLPAWLFVVGGSVAYGTFRLAEFDGAMAHREAIRIAVVQSDVPQSNKMNASEAQERANFIELMRLSERAIAMDPRPHLIVWPETMAPYPLNDETQRVYEAVQSPKAEFRVAMQRFVETTGVALIAGSHAYFGWEQSAEGFRWGPDFKRYNSAYLLRPGGTIERYDKVHRVPFGEFIPGMESVPALKGALLALTPYEDDYTLRAGGDYTVFALDAGPETWRVAAPICFEDVVSYVPRRMVYDAAGAKRCDVLVNLSNDGWFVGSPEFVQHEQQARFRCVETRTPMARSVNRGASGFIDSCGRVTGFVEVGGRRELVAGVAAADMVRDSRATVFGRIGDAFAAACSLAALLMLAACFVRRRKAGSS